MNSEITNNEEKNEWPKLMESVKEQFVILQNKDNSGTVVHSNSKVFHLGLYQEYWNKDVFKPFTGKITLWN